MSQAAALHPALFPAAGLTSGEAHRAHDRWSPLVEACEYNELATSKGHQQVALPLPQLTPNYTNVDIPLSQPHNVPRMLHVGQRCVNPLEPRYILPGASALVGSTGSPKGTHSRADSPKFAAGGARASLPSPVRSSSLHAMASERLTLPAMPLSRLGSMGNMDSSTLPGSPKPHGCGSFGHLPSNPNLNTNGAVGGLLLYGPSHGSTAPGAESPSRGNRNLDVTDINGPRRNAASPMRRSGAYDPLYVGDIVPPRTLSPTRRLTSLTTSDIRGATVRPRTRDVPSPGRGTLVAADIPGAAPASLARASPSSYALGRWPAPAVPQHQFSTGARVTMLKKPQMSAD